jgi:hypothetical protein
MIRRRRLLPTGIRLFTPASFIYMPTAKLPHKPFANPERKIGEKKAQSGKSCSAWSGKNWQANSIFAGCVYRGLIIGLAPEE